MMNSEAVLALARQVLEIESAAITGLIPRLDESFVHAHQLLLDCPSKVVVSGMGKSGHIGNKIAATLASTGTPAFFLHPAEASHGDLGMISPQDVLIALSHSGESEELLLIAPLLKRRGTPIISITGNPNSRLARISDVHLNTAVAREACPLNLAPTSSTTAALAMGDALAVSLLQARGFTAADFALTHPGGSLGRQLLLRVDEVMHRGERVPQVRQTASLLEALHEMSQKGLGMTAVVDEAGRLQGIFTDGDLRRALEAGQDRPQLIPVSQVMTRNPVTIAPQQLASEAAVLMQQRRIFGLFVVNDQGQVLGAFNMHDLLRAGIV
jgi:arabinose-5-phosphate isomerase